MSDETQPEEIETPAAPADPCAWPGAEPKQAAFLTALVFYAGHHSKAAKAAQVARSTTYRWIEQDEAFQALYALAERRAFRVLEDEMIRRAKEGVGKGIYFQGERVAVEKVYSDGLMMMLARAGNPEKYRERHDVTGKVDLNLKFKGSLEDLLATYRELQAQPEAAA